MARKAITVLSLFPLLALTMGCAALVVTVSGPGDDSGQGTWQGEMDADDAQHSALWGRGGELFDPRGRLPDFSYAGYGFGQRPIPEPRAVASVTDFGADGSDNRDDTEAFLRAISTVRSGAIDIPPGEYLISDKIVINKPGIVLRGAGSDETVISISRALHDLYPKESRTGGGQVVSAYSWSGGFITFEGWTKKVPRSRITQAARRGDRALAVEMPHRLRAGDLVRVTLEADEAGTLTDHLYAGESAGTENIRSGYSFSMLASVDAVDGDAVTLNRPLPWDVRPEWSPSIGLNNYTLSESGIEGLTIRFPALPYEGHFTERGRNALVFVRTFNCWAREIVIENADSGIFFNSTQGTLQNITFRSVRQPTKGRTGHHGVQLGSHNLMRDFRFESVFHHDITVSKLNMGNVVKGGSGVNLSLDHHKSANYANLFTDLDAGLGTHLWVSGGAPSRGLHAGAYNTFWCIRADRPIPYPPEVFGPDSINLVGVQSDRPSTTIPGGVWDESLDPEKMVPKDLHLAQLRRRLLAEE